MNAVKDIPAPTLPEHNRTGISYRRPMPRPKVRGSVIDAHCHLLANRHADGFFAAADHFGIDLFFTMGPLDEAMSLQRRWGHRYSSPARSCSPRSKARSTTRSG